MRVRRDPPGPGQESVWDYPRPPRLERSAKHVLVQLGGEPVAETRRAWRVLETSHPPNWYVPREDVVEAVLARSRTAGSWCEFKGAATYWDVTAGGIVRPAAAWSYEKPSRGYEELAGALAFYPGRFECTVDGEPVLPQEGGFYGGWITPEVVGPFKGAPGTLGW